MTRRMIPRPVRRSRSNPFNLPEKPSLIRPPGPYALVSKRLNPSGAKASISTAVVAGSSAGVCYWSVVYPLAVVKVCCS
jgi:hypothetical protein